MREVSSCPYFGYDPGQIDLRNVTLKVLILLAYPAGDWAFFGPGWLDSVKLDLVAKLPASAASLPVVDRWRLMTRPMLQTLLAERFKLKIHQEVKDLPGYALVIAPGGPKIHRVEAATRIRRLQRGFIVGSSVPLMQVVEFLKGDLQRPVQDLTGLTGNYEIHLTWTPVTTVPVRGENTTTAPDDQAPSIFTAVQEQLGLKLESRRVPTNMVYVDHVERVPDRQLTDSERGFGASAVLA